MHLEAGKKKRSRLQEAKASEGIQTAFLFFSTTYLSRNVPCDLLVPPVASEVQRIRTDVCKGQGLSSGAVGVRTAQAGSGGGHLVGRGASQRAVMC